MSIEIEGTVPVTPEHSSRNATCRLEVGFAVSVVVEKRADEKERMKDNRNRQDIAGILLRME